MPVLPLTTKEMTQEPLPEKPNPTIQKTTSPILSEAEIRQKIHVEYSALRATFVVAARILAIRFFLFLSLIGSFTLSVIATDNRDPQSLYVLLAYFVCTTLPLSVLELKNRG